MAWGSRRFVALVAVVLPLVAGAAACSNKPKLVASQRPVASTSSSTAAPSTTAEPTTTTAAPTTTEAPTTTAPAAPQVVDLTQVDAKAVLTPGGILVPVLQKQADGDLVQTPCGKTAVVARGIPVDGTVVLDPGHGGKGEPGAQGPSGFLEKDLNWAVTNYTKDALEAAGVHVVMTRSGDYLTTLDTRAKINAAINPKAFVSIHHNAEPDGPRDGPGSETYYQTVGTSAAQSKRLAGLIYEEIVKALSQYQGVAWVADTDAGAKYRKGSSGDDYYAVIRKTHGTPAALAELGFISNPPEEALYQQPAVQKVEGEAVAKGIMRFLTTTDPGSGFVEPYPRTEPAGGGGTGEGCTDPAL
ncbi:MAG TPA: N-acetylmuramoyl-L-alanine amidase [Acidimicrobiales bacterium]|nr:N-acetylmuramoyl-L-alanine amidase [Acidimicrobiales bacterium]